MHTTMLCSLRRVLQRDDVLALAPGIADLGDRGRRVLEQPRAIGRIGPGLCDDARAVARPDFLFIGLDQQIERGWVDITLFGQHRFQRAHAKLGFGQLRMVMVVMMVVIVRQT